MAENFEYTCSQCRESLTLPISLLGQQGECPTCHHVETLQESSASLTTSTPPGQTDHADPASPFGGAAPVTAENLPTAANPYAVPAANAFQFGMVNPDDRGRLGLTLWISILSFIISTIWMIVVIVTAIVSVIMDNPQRFEGLNEDQAIQEVLTALSGLKSDELEELKGEQWREKIVIGIASHLGIWLVIGMLLFLVGIICYLIFIHTLWAQIKDSPDVKFSPAAIVLLQLAPLAIMLFSFLLGSISPLLSGLLMLVAAIVNCVVSFITYWKLAEYMEKYCQQQAIQARICSPGLALAYCIAQIVGSIPLIGLGGLVSLAAMVMWFMVVFGLKNCAIDIINHKMRLEQERVYS